MSSTSSATHGPSVSQVDFHFDIMCPYAYQTSKWIRRVREMTGITINWRFFSLEEVNRREGKKHPWEREWSYGWSLLRVAALAGRTDPMLVDRWYEAAGYALHEQGRKAHDPETAAELAAEIGLPDGVVQAALADETTNDEVLADHRRVVDAGGYGVPTLFFPEFDDHCLFGPVLINPPEGEAALRLWHATIAWLEFPDVYELQQPKTKYHEQRIAKTFETYLNARDWVSINRGKVVDFTEDGFEVRGVEPGDSLSNRS
jgi:2-hydroxychromene-2-carboxylate isomerase